MNTTTGHHTARDSLRRLTSPHAMNFGSRPLRRGIGGVITFRGFVAVAREFVSQMPEQSAVHLAALVDMCRDMIPHEPARPSGN